MSPPYVWLHPFWTWTIQGMCDLLSSRVCKLIPTVCILRACGICFNWSCSFTNISFLMLTGSFLFSSLVDYVPPHIISPVRDIVFGSWILPLMITIICTWMYFQFFPLLFFFLNLCQLRCSIYFTAHKREGLQELISKDDEKDLTCESRIILSMVTCEIP